MGWEIGLVLNLLSLKDLMRGNRGGVHQLLIGLYNIFPMSCL